MTEFFSKRTVAEFPRIPLEGHIDLTYRCNNNCRHCWLWIPPDSPEKKNELTLKEIKWIVEEARSMGCRSWGISGGEPMLRPDFVEILEYIQKRSASYSLNTNGTLITPEIASLMKKPGFKMIVLYGATAEVHDHITRTPGSFEAFLRGVAYLREAKAGFVVQIIPMRDNFHQFDDMVKLAESLSPVWRVGASWLYFSAARNPDKNKEIRAQRLKPTDVARLMGPKPNLDEEPDRPDADSCPVGECGGFHIADCTARRQDFHVDAYGQMSICAFVKDSRLRCDLRAKGFERCWEMVLPSWSEVIVADQEFREGCGSCRSRRKCRWCPVYAYLECGRYNAKIPYLCSVSRAGEKIRQSWSKNHSRFYRIAGITIRVESDLPFKASTFHQKFKAFEAEGPAEDTVVIRHCFSIPHFEARNLGEEVHRLSPWVIFRKGDSWIYVGSTSGNFQDGDFHRLAVFNKDHSRGTIYHPDDRDFREGKVQALTFFPTDQILLARLLADRDGCYVHSCGIVFEGKGLLFAGHSEAGKSTMIKMLAGQAEILCDDRIIIRKWPAGFRIHGTWSHGEVPVVSANSAPLQAVFFLEKSAENRIIQIDNPRDILSPLLGCVIRPLVTADWWGKILSLAEALCRDVPFYSVRFDKSGEIVGVLRDFIDKSISGPSARKHEKILTSR